MLLTKVNSTVLRAPTRPPMSKQKWRRKKVRRFRDGGFGARLTNCRTRVLNIPVERANPSPSSGESRASHFKEALALGVRDVYLLGAYADFLLDRDRPQEVRSLLEKEVRIDPLLLSLALAEQSARPVQLEGADDKQGGGEAEREELGGGAGPYRRRRMDRSSLARA
jgi:hypothetical protein